MVEHSEGFGVEKRAHQCLASLAKITVLSAGKNPARAFKEPVGYASVPNPSGMLPVVDFGRR